MENHKEKVLIFFENFFKFIVKSVYLIGIEKIFRNSYFVVSTGTA